MSFILKNYLLLEFEDAQKVVLGLHRKVARGAILKVSQATAQCAL